MLPREAESEKESERRESERYGKGLVFIDIANNSHARQKELKVGRNLPRKDRARPNSAPASAVDEAADASVASAVDNVADPAVDAAVDGAAAVAAAAGVAESAAFDSEQGEGVASPDD